MERDKEDQDAHDNMLRTRADKLNEEKYSVKADLEEYEDKPEEINGKQPDIIATKDGEKIIVEVETCKSYSLDHTKEQYEAFSSVSGAEFQVVIPKSCYEEAKAKAEEWGIKGIQWWTNSDY